MLKQWMARAVLGRTSVGATLEPSDRPDAAFEASWRRQMRTRLLVALGMIVAWAVVVEARLVFLQVVSHEEFAARARQQQQSVFEPEPARGDILDRNGEMLAYSVESHRVIAYPSRSENPEKDAAEICAALGDCVANEQARLAANLAKDTRYLVVRKPRAVSPAASLRLQALIDARRNAKLPGVVDIVSESRRYYPKMTLASHVLGFVNDTGQGTEGIEAKYDRVIAGEKGRVFVQVDGKGGREISTHVERAPTAGAALELTIDLRLQHIVERELANAVQSTGADGGSVLVMDPFTGEILAQASYPTFNPNVYWSEPGASRRNRVVTDTYEPGSTFKIVTASAALNDGIFRTTDLIDTSPGIIKIEGRKPIDEAHSRNYGVLSFEDVLIKSSNVGAIKIGQRLGADRLIQYVRRFGFGQTLAPDFAGQSRGRVYQPGQVNDSALASISMGYEIGVTPLQIAAAASVIANGGSLVEPHILRAVIRDGRREVVAPKAIRRVITPETAATMTALMEGVTERGTAKGAALTRYQVAGKTGTAAKVVNGRYSDSEYNVSFIGFVPSRKPVLTILVVIDTPRRGPAYGGTIAAPVFKRIAESSLQQIGVPPSIDPATPIVTTTGQFAPQPPSRAAEIPTISRVGGRPVMPDLRGLSLRDAIRIANAIGLSMTTDGEGVVVTQSPLPGEFVDAGGSGSLRLRRHPAPDRSGR
jgi:cell division protein FtsI (penicillin-binding protein 3)